MKEVLEVLEQENIGKIEKNVSLKKYTTYRVGGVASAIIYPKNIDALVRSIKILKDNHITYKILGNGSNLLFSDKKYEGVLIKLSAGRCWFFFNETFFTHSQERFDRIRVRLWYSWHDWRRNFHECRGL